MPDFGASELATRIEKLQSVMAAKDIDWAILSQNSDIYYYTGSMQPLYAVIPASGVPFVLARKAINRIQDEVGQMPMEAFLGGREMLEILQRRGVIPAARVGFTLDTLSYIAVTRFQRSLGDAEIVDLSWDIRMLRAVKSDAEIAIQTRAAGMMTEVPQLLRTRFRPGMTELELAAAMENHFRLKGHCALIRCRREGVEMSGLGVLSSGVNSLAGTKFEGICGGAGISPAVPYGAGLSRIEKGVPVIVDFAFNLDGYIVDQTRMFSWGAPSDEVTKAYDSMVEVERMVLESLRPGKPWEVVYDEAVALATQMGYADSFMGFGTEKVKFIGHGVGLELDEPPFLAPGMPDPLVEGMVLAVEPKVGMPGVGVIGIEDTVVIRSSGCENLTMCDPAFIVID